MRELTLQSPLGLLIAAVLLTGLGSANARTCDRHQFWSAFYDKCTNCTICVHPDIVITPCQGHRDTICGPLSDLKIDWSWMRRGQHNKNRVKEMTETFKENMQEIKLHEYHVREKERMLRRLQKHRKDASDADADLAMMAGNHELWTRLKAFGRDVEKKEKVAAALFKNLPKAETSRERAQVPHDQLLQSLHFDSEEAKELLNSSTKDSDDEEEEDDDDDDDDDEEDDDYDDSEVEKERKPQIVSQKLVKNFGFFPVNNEEEQKHYEEDYAMKDSPEVSPEVSEKELDFSTTERIVLDYQAGVLYIALASIVIFFLVALCYSLKHLRTWGNYNYREDLEELKNWIWTQSHKQQAKPMPSTIYKSTTEVVSKEASGNCKYLERIISKNAKRKMNRVPQNVYQGAHPSLETRPLTASIEELEVHKPTCV